VRGLLGVLRNADDVVSHAPAGGLAAVDTLAERTAAAGVPVSVRVEGEPVALSPGVDLAAYRVIQEALTNVLRHAGDARAEVHVCYRPQQLDISITDDGRSRALATSGSRQGLLGIRERVNAWGGTLDYGPRPGGGFRVAAVIPLAGTP